MKRILMIFCALLTAITALAQEPAAIPKSVFVDGPPEIIDETASDVPMLLPEALKVPDALGPVPTVVEIPDDGEGSLPTEDPEINGRLAPKRGSDTAQIASWPLPLRPKSFWKPLSESLMVGQLSKEKTEEKKEKIEGTLTIEEHPVKRRSFFRRWIIVTEDDTRVPLGSNLAVLQAVKTKGIFESKVRADGNWVKPANSSAPPFFIVEKLVLIDQSGKPLNASGVPDIASDSLLPASGTLLLASGTVDLASATEALAFGSGEAAAIDVDSPSGEIAPTADNRDPAPETGTPVAGKIASEPGVVASMAATLASASAEIVPGTVSAELSSPAVSIALPVAKLATDTPNVGSLAADAASSASAAVSAPAPVTASASVSLPASAPQR
jgi:hypothetical protein